MIIPKAYTSKAIVFCDGVKGRCFLSDSFNRMMELQVMGHSSPLRNRITSYYIDTRVLVSPLYIAGTRPGWKIAHNSHIRLV